MAAEESTAAVENLADHLDVISLTCHNRTMGLGDTVGSVCPRGNCMLEVKVRLLGGAGGETGVTRETTRDRVETMDNNALMYFGKPELFEMVKSLGLKGYSSTSSTKAAMIKALRTNVEQSKVVHSFFGKLDGKKRPNDDDDGAADGATANKKQAPLDSVGFTAASSASMSSFGSTSSAATPTVDPMPSSAATPTVDALPSASAASTSSAASVLNPTVVPPPLARQLCQPGRLCGRDRPSVPEPSRRARAAP